jgi:hypothetical protein
MPGGTSEDFAVAVFLSVGSFRLEGALLSMRPPVGIPEPCGPLRNGAGTDGPRQPISHAADRHPVSALARLLSFSSSRFRGRSGACGRAALAEQRITGTRSDRFGHAACRVRRWSGGAAAW